LVLQGHIGDYVELNIQDPQAEISDLEAFFNSSNFLSIQFVQPRPQNLGRRPKLKQNLSTCFEELITMADLSHSFIYPDAMLGCTKLSFTSVRRIALNKMDG
jgi:hypothetical protein